MDKVSQENQTFKRQSIGKMGVLGGIVFFFCAAICAFGWNLRSEPHFVDESAYIAQSFYWDLLIQNDRDSPYWLLYEAQDLPPLPKYAIGAILSASGSELPTLADSRRWYDNTSTVVGSGEMQVWARWPSVVLGAVGVASVWVIGAWAFGWRAGALAALFLILNPLYWMHSRRAMSDVPAEAFIQLSLLLTIWAWLDGRERWRGVAVFALAGVAGGLAVLSKLNGGLILMTIAALTVWTWVWPGWDWRGRARATLGAMMAGGCAFVVFCSLNPFVTGGHGATHYAMPAPVAERDESIWKRIGRIIDHRVSVSRRAAEQFPHNALNNPGSKLTTSLVQGFGRFGPLGPARADSTNWLDPRQDWGAVLWLPCVIAGAIIAWRRGRESPAARIVWLHFVVAFVTVTLFLPLAWDRYLMSIQPPACLLAAAFLEAVWIRLTGRKPDLKEEAPL